MFKGYHRNEEATREVFDGDAVRTGDLGELDDGYLRITGRKKDLIITSSGKNISPTNIENALRESRWISQAVVHGDNRSYLVALLTLDADEAPALAAGARHRRRDVARDGRRPERVREALQRDVDAANSQFARIEQVKKFVVLEQDLSQEAGELTPTMKVKRAVGRAALRGDVQRAVRRVARRMLAVYAASIERRRPARRARGRRAARARAARRLDARSRSARPRSTTTTSGRCAASACRRTGCR